MTALEDAAREVVAMWDRGFYLRSAFTGPRMDALRDALHECPECHGRGLVQKSAYGKYDDRGNGWSQVWNEPCPQGMPHGDDMRLVNRWRRQGLTFTAIQVLRPEPGDTLVLNTDMNLHVGEVERLRAQLATVFPAPDYQTVVLCAGMKLTVVRPSESEHADEH